MLRGLNSNDPGPSWSRFIDHYAPLILRVSNRFDYEQDRSGECFLFVCEQLCDRGFRRLLGFDIHGKASFNTWLGTVVFNLCVDWHRKTFGRATLLPSIEALPAFDRAVYRYRYQQRLPVNTCYEVLREEFPDLSRDQLARALGRIHEVLTPRQRWRLSIRSREIRGPRPSSGLATAESLASDAADPSEQALRSQQLEQLDRALSRLPTDQAFLLRLRYQQGVTLREVARLAGLGDPYRARRHIEAALKALSMHLEQENIPAGRKN
jgi:RNA polymerase sigma factor (sigma-70 family)